MVQLDDARTWMVTLGRKTAQEKVASFLLLLLEHIGKPSPDNPAHKEFMLPLKRADIADFLGLTLETVSRQMTKLRKMDIIDIEKNLDITVRDEPRLIAISGGE